MRQVWTGSNENTDAERVAAVIIIWGANSSSGNEKRRDEIKYTSMQWENN